MDSIESLCLGTCVCYGWYGITVFRNTCITWVYIVDSMESLCLGTRVLRECILWIV